jgi:3-dehydroquinate synthase
MLKELDANPYENLSAERLVDMGHTFSPYLEAVSGFTIPHGEAVSVDMALTSLISAELGILPEQDAHAIIGSLYELGLPVWSPLLTRELCSSAADQMVLQRRGELNLVALESIGRPVFLKRRSAIDGELLARAIDKLAAIHYSMEPSLSSSNTSSAQSY